MTPEEQAAADAVKATADKKTADDAAAAAAAKTTETGKTTEDEKFDRAYVERLRTEAQATKAELKALKDAAAKREEADAASAADHKKVADLATKRADAAEKKLNEATEGMNKRLINTELRAAAREAGILDVDDVKLLDAKDVTVDDDGNVIGAKAVIDKFKADKPHKFKAADGTTTDDKGDKLNDGEGAKRLASTNSRANGKPTDFGDKSIPAAQFEEAWSKA